MMLSVARIKKLGSMVFVAFCFQYFIIFYVFNQSTTAYKHKLIPRHKTIKEIRGPTYHVHKVDPMPIDLRERYESRRLLVESNRPKLVSRREILSEYRRSPSDASQNVETERYTSLEKESSRGEMLSCSTCALVSNSGHILGSRLGDEIDRANCVFRLNAAPSVGYELDVGRRTTARVASRQGIREVLANATTLLDGNLWLSTVFLHGPDHVFSLGSLPRVITSLSNKYPKLDLYRPTKVVEREADAAFEKHTGKTRMSLGAEFSTGLYALMIMKDVCTDIKVYGMTPENYCRSHPDSTVPYSYFKRPSLPECEMYNYHETISEGGQHLMTERGLFHTWAKTHGISFYSPSWE